MKTADITPLATYALREKSYGSTNVALVVENVLWVEKAEWFPKADGSGREERRILRRAGKGSRAGSGSNWGRAYSKTGIPLLKLSSSDYMFMNGTDVERRIVDTAHELLTRAMEKLQLLDLVDSGQSVFFVNDEGQTRRKTRTTVQARYADGHTGEVSAELELVRPQAILLGWDEHLKAAEKEAVRKAELDQRRSEAKAESNKTAWSIRDRVGALLDDVDQQRYNPHDERYDVHREWTGSGFSSKYEISQDTLLKLLALAEKGTNQ